VTDVSEISFVDDLPGAESDLDGLAAFDSNGDGKLSAADARFAEFGLWLDADGDGAVDQGETKTLAAIGIASINLTGTAVESTKALGEVAVVNTGTFTWVDGRTMALADAALTYFAAATNMPYFPPDVRQLDGAPGDYSLSVSGGKLGVLGANGAVGDKLEAFSLLAFEFSAYGSLAPVVLDLDGDGFGLTAVSGTGATFDMNGDGLSDDTGWIGRGDGFLVIDRNNDGKITDAAELSLAAETGGATGGLEGLARLDSNRDGVVDANDARFRELRVWVDVDGDGITDLGELRTLADAGIKSVSVKGVATADRTIALGDSALLATASFTRADGSVGTAGEATLGYRPAYAPPLRAYQASDALADGNSAAAFSLFDLPSDSAAFDRFAQGDFGKPADEQGPDGGAGAMAATGGDDSVSGLEVRTAAEGVDTARRLALLSQDMGAFGAGSADLPVAWWDTKDAGLGAFA